ncbi:hypothetical protein TNCV_2266341 [Trichonephila clavipes]|nr:hypothetical protein TNCV_2266341 [Trichonephila clavipes]
MPPDRQRPDQGPRNSSGQRAKLCLSLSVALSTIQVTARFCSVSPNFEGEHPRGGHEPPTSLSFPPTSREDLWLDGYFKYPHAAKSLYIYKHPCLLLNSNPGQRHSSQHC